MGQGLQTVEGDTQLSHNRIVEFFRSSSHPHLAQYVGEVDEARVVLAGTCRSFHTKQLAQNVAARCPGVQQVINTMEVQISEGNAW